MTTNEKESKLVNKLEVKFTNYALINKRNKDKLICADMHITCTWRDR